MNQTSITINNGVQIPQFGLGVYSIPDGEITYNSVLAALKAGYRHIDTAHAYGNERSVGRAIKDSGIPRDSIWVTSKLWPNEYGEDVTPKQLDKMLERLGLEYLDLVYLHQPLRDYNGGWKALEAALEAGKVRAIGISDFDFELSPEEMAKMASLNQEKRYFTMNYQQIKDWMENYELWD